MKSTTLILIALTLAACGSSEGDSSSSATVWDTPASKSSPSELKADTNDSSSSDKAEPEASPAELPRGKQPTTGCERFYVLGQQPKIVDPKLNEALSPKKQDLCYRAFAVSYSGLTRTPIWVGEALSSRQLQFARNISRNSQFLPDPTLNAEDRSELADYRGSGWERGHMAPSADMPSREAQAESFYLSNIIPQNAMLNGGKWARLEQSVRRQAMSNDVFVITGPIFQNSRQALKKRVLVPTSVFKAVFIDGEGAVVYVAENRSNGRWDTFSIDQFKSVYGIDLYPGLPPLIRTHNLVIGGSLRAKPREGAKGAGKDNDDGNVSNKPKTMASENGRGMLYSIEKFREIHGRMPRNDELE